MLPTSSLSFDLACSEGSNDLQLSLIRSVGSLSL